MMSNCNRPHGHREGIGHAWSRYGWKSDGSPNPAPPQPHLAPKRSSETEVALLAARDWIARDGLGWAHSEAAVEMLKHLVAGFERYFALSGDAPGGVRK